MTLLAMLFALSLALSFLESGLSALVPVPGIKLGLSNIVVMFCLFFLGARPAYTLAGLKAGFVLLTRGPVGAAMSLSGGLLSVSVMLLLFYIGKGKTSDGFLSIAGGLFHNIGQLAVASVILASDAVYYYLPVLAASGIGMGFLNGLLLRLLKPRFQSIFSGGKPDFHKSKTPEEELEK